MALGTYRGAHLDMELPYRLAVVHGVKSRNLIDPHGRHLQPACNFVHDADAGEAVLALAEIEEGHHGGFFVLGGITFEDFGNEFFIGVVEFEWYGGIVFGAISMLTCMALMKGETGLEGK